METLPKKVRAPKTNKVVQEEKVKAVAEFLLKGETRTFINEYCVSNYGIALATVNNLVFEAYKFIGNNYKVDRASIVETHIKLYYNIYLNAVEHSDRKSAMKALESIERLLKLHQPDVALQQNNISLSLKDIDLEQLKSLL